MTTFWREVKFGLPISPMDDDKLFLFVYIYEDMIIGSWLHTWVNIKKFRAFEIDNKYTHYIQLEEPKPTT